VKIFSKDVFDKLAFLDEFFDMLALF